jgi:autotransporter-associated beta strand protein
MSTLAGGSYHIIGGSGTITTGPSANPSAINADIAIRNGNSILSINVAKGTAATDLLISGVIKDDPWASGNGISKTGAGTLALSGANIYTGPTTILGGTLLVNGSLSTGAVNVGAGGYLGGTGTIGGNTIVSNSAVLIAGTLGTYGTNTFTGNLTVNSGATNIFKLGTVYNGTNDQIIVGGTLVNNGFILINAPSAAVNLDTNQDYVLMTSAGLSGSFSSTPLWGVKPLNSANFTLVINGNNLQLHYTVSALPTATGSASPATVTRNQSTLISVTVTNGSGTVDPNTGVTLNESPLGGGLGTVYLVLSSTISSTIHVYTNTIYIPGAAAAGSYNLNATITDSLNSPGSASVSLLVMATNQVWNGAGADFYTDDNTNWVSGSAPGYIGDSTTFAGTVNTNVDMDQNYIVTGLTFNTNAGSFTISSAESDTLTLASGSGVVNNSTNAQTLNVPVVLGAAQTINAASGDINVGGSISGTGALTKTGNNALTFSADNTLDGVVNVNNGTLAITNGTTTLNNGGNPNFFIGTSNATATVLVSGTATLNSTTANTFLRLGVDAANNAGIGIINNSSANSTVNIGGYGMGFGQNSANGKGVVYNSGTFNSTAGGVYMGNQDNAYAYFLNSGTVAASGNFFIAHNDATTTNGANAVLDITAGTVTVSSGNSFKLNDQNRAYTGTSGGAQANITGGALSLGTDGTTIQLNQGGNNYSAMNITGTGIVTSTGSSGFELAVNSAATALTTLTVENGGMLETAFINKAGTSSSGILNFNNGILTAVSADATALIRANVTTYIHAGGATIDDNGNSVTVASAMLAPAGNGVTGITLSGTTNGYIGAPVVKITGGGGQGAAAIATFDQASGKLTGIVVTSPGSGYTSAPTVTLAGGNGSATATATIGAVSSGGLTKVGSGTVTLSGANTYTGNTTISNGTLAVATGGSISSTNIIVTSGTILDSSASTFSMGNGQKLLGDGAVNGLAAGSGSKIFPGTDGTVGTLTFNSGGLTLGSGATVNFDLSTTYNGANDQITGYGTLTLNGNAIHIKAPSNLDNSGNDYVLITASSISGSFASTPVWDVRPANAANFSVVTDPANNQVRLHYSTLNPPTGAGVAIPSTAVHGQTVLLSVTVTNGSGSISTVTVDASPIGGSSSVTLVLSGTPHVYTNSLTIPSSPAAGSYTLTATITDSNSLQGTANIALTVNTTEVWNGAGSDLNWSTALNWASGVAPDLSGNSLIFAGTAGSAPNMDGSYSVIGLSFSNNAGSFIIGTTGGTLTLNGGVTNNSANTQRLNVPVVLGGAATLASASGGLVLEQPVSEATTGGGALTTTGNVTLVATNTYTGSTTINAGSLVVAGQLNSGDYSAAITANGTLNFSSPSSQILSGAINGTGGLTVNATNGGILTLGSGATSSIGYTGSTLVNSGELQLNFDNNPSSYGIASSSGLTINNGGTVTVMNDNSLCGYNTALGSLPVTINNGGVLTCSASAGSGAGTSSHIRGLLTLQGGTFASGGTGQGYWGTWNLDDGVVVNGGTNTSTISALDVTLSQAGGTIFAITNGGTASGVDLNVSGTIVNAGGTGDTGLILTGNGTLSLAGANTYTSATTIGSGNTLILAAAGQLGGGAYAGDITNNGALVSKTTAGQTLSGIISGTGSLVVNSAGGTLILSGANTYTGNTTISAGTLELTQSSATLATNSTVTIASGAQLQLGAASVTNQVASLVTNGVAAGNGLYSSANSSGFITGSGYLQVGAVVVGPSGPASITSSISGNSLNLTWPAGQGWRLESQTNSLSTGLTPNGWSSVSGVSDGSAAITIDPAKPTVFYRLVYP